MFGKDSKILNFINVRRTSPINRKTQQARTIPLPNDVFVRCASDSKQQMSKNQLEAQIKKFLNNDSYEISCNRAIFSNLDKVDLKNAHVHLKNICTLLAGASNSNDKIMNNGYFSSDEGAKAFETLSKLFSNKSQSGKVSPLSVVLADYKPETIFILEKRGLLDPNQMDNYRRLNSFAKMSDEEYEVFQEKVQRSIDATGHTFEELSETLKEEVQPLIHPRYFEHFEKRYLNKEQVVAQLELFSNLKNFPIEFNDYSLVDILGSVNIENIDSCKNMLSVLKDRKDISKYNVPNILSITNNDTEKILSELLQNKEIPIQKILDYCNNNDFKKGILSREDVLKKINNDPFIKSVQAIKNTSFDLKPNNVNQEILDPHNIQPDALALVHMTKYEPEEGKILSTRDKIGGSRNSVHFTLNHAVTNHRGGIWDECDYAVIMPYSSTVKLNGDNKFIEGMPNDLYTNGSVEMPEGSIIMKHNSELPSGTVKFSEHPSIKGVKLIETSEKPHDLVPAVIEKMGYSHLQADAPIGLFSYGKQNGNSIDEVMDNLVAWRDFCDKNGLKATRHTGSPNDIAEKLIEKIAQLCVNNTWNREKGQFNYKKDLLENLDYARKLQQKGYYISYDLDALEEIIIKSFTPQEAVDRMPKELGFHPTLKYDWFNDCSFREPLDLYSEWYNVEDSLDDVKEFLLQKELKYL